MKDNTLTNMNREPWIDDVRMFAMAIVVIGHITAALHIPNKSWLGYWYVGFDMPLFVILSAYCGYKGFARITTLRDCLEYLKKIAIRMSIPVVVVSMIVNMFWSFVAGDYIVALKQCVICTCVGGVSLVFQTLYVKKCVPWISYFLILLMPYTFFSRYWFIVMLQILMCIFMVSAFIIKKAPVLSGGGNFDRYDLLLLCRYMLC